METPSFSTKLSYAVRIGVLYSPLMSSLYSLPSRQIYYQRSRHTGMTFFWTYNPFCYYYCSDTAYGDLLLQIEHDLATHSFLIVTQYYVRPAPLGPNVYLTSAQRKAVPHRLNLIPSKALLPSSFLRFAPNQPRYSFGSTTDTVPDKKK